MDATVTKYNKISKLPEKLQKILTEEHSASEWNEIFCNLSDEEIEEVAKIITKDDLQIKLFVSGVRSSFSHENSSQQKSEESSTQESIWNFTPKRVAETVKKMSELMSCDYKIAYEKYCHDIIKQEVSWEEVQKYL